MSRNDQGLVAAILFGVFTVCSLVGLAAWVAVKPSRDMVEPRYAFDIPYLFLSCLQYDVPAFERFGNFDIKQPMVITLHAGSLFYDSRIESSHFCEPTVQL